MDALKNDPEFALADARRKELMADHVKNAAPIKKLEDAMNDRAHELAKKPRAPKGQKGRGLPAVGGVDADGQPIGVDEAVRRRKARNSKPRRHSNQLYTKFLLV